MSNTLKDEYSDIFKEWNYDKNTYRPEDMTIGSQKIVWWTGSCGHEWKTAFRDRIRRKGRGCPYCANPPKVLKGFNDLWTTNPKLAQQLANPDDGYKYTQNSKKKVEWVCLECQSLIGEKLISNVHQNGLCCHFCSKNTSTPERIMSSYLREGEIEFETQKSFKWLPNRLYDFYLPKFNLIVETHGEYHYEQHYKNNAKSLEEIQAIDEMKKREALKNGINNYIVIDCSKSEIRFVKQSIEKSELKELMTKEADWSIIANNSATRRTKEIWKLWNNGMSIEDIIQHTKLGRWIVYESLKHGEMSSECSYTPTASKTSDHSKIKIVQLSTDGQFIQTWDSLVDAKNGLNMKSTTGISRCLVKPSSICYGFKWIYLSDYEKLTDS